MALTRTSRLSRVVLGPALIATVLLGPVAAQALPSPSTPTVASVTAGLTKLAISNEKLTEQLNAAKIAVGKAQTRQKSTSQVAAEANARLRQTQRVLSASVSAQYKASSVSAAAALLTSKDGTGYVQTIQSLDVLASHQAGIAAEARSASDQAAKADADARSAVTDAVEKRDEVAAKQATLAKEIAKYQRMLDALTAAQLAAYHARETAAPVVVQRVVTQLPKLSVNATGHAAAAVQAALSKRGDPYVWGAAGPDQFDCSGLTSWAWAQAGVSLPHNAAAQQSMVTPVPTDQLAPGDLVFFGSPAYHVGMYIGDGLFVHAPTSGDVVKVSALSSMSDFAGGGRVG